MSPKYTGGLYQQPSVKVHMTAKLQQAVRILQLSTPDLLAYVRQELEENPLLEAVDIQWDPFPGITRRNRNQRVDPLQQAADSELSLEKHLRQQLGLMPFPPQTIWRIALYMIGNLDHNGYLELSLEQIADTLQVNHDDAAAALSLVQTLEPIGTGARNLSECLLLQVKQWPACPPLVPQLIRAHLDDIAHYRLHKLAKLLKVSEEEIQHAIGVIRGLNPRPGASFHGGETLYIVPDVIIGQVGEQFVVSIPDAAIPHLGLNPNYERMAKELGRTDEARQFLHAKLSSAAFFIRCIEQRRLTLLRVARAIVEEQAEFFQKGVSYLKPMVLKHIADIVGLHESTISRATSGKYAQTPWGNFELPFFFPSGFHLGQGDAASAVHIKERIREWVREEEDRKPYSDQKLADMLAEEGIPISRRTVTKYREELGISSSIRRKHVGR
jgi:RNA polymerase sigma-54 factor